jgi:Cysteine-rich secretory protein family
LLGIRGVLSIGWTEFVRLVTVCLGLCADHQYPGIMMGGGISMRKSGVTVGVWALALVALSACTMGTVPGGPAPAAAVASQAAIPTGGFGAMMNAQRATAGLPPASADARLTAAAQAHAEAMAAGDFFSHAGANGSNSSDRIRAAGYTTCRSSENIAFGQRSEAEVFQVWVNSPPHLANIMMRGSIQYGLGHAGNKWVLDVAGVC